MLKFNKSNIKELEIFLYNSYIHDAQFKSVRYDHQTECLEIQLINSIFGIKINLVFNDVEIVFAVRGNEIGSKETVSSLTLEEDFSYLENYIRKITKNLDNSLYFLFQMFSGDELHIVCKEVRTSKGDDSVS